VGRGVQGGNKVAGRSGDDVSGVGGSMGVEGGDVAVLALRGREYRQFHVPKARKPCHRAS
jgi:hypothetical protein